MTTAERTQQDIAHWATDEAGSSLLEVIFGAVLVLLVLGAVLAGLDASASTTGLHRSQAVASSLAEQDQERLHSLPINTLAGVSTSRVVAVGGVDYTVASRADWVSDAGGNVSCTNNSTSVDYLSISSSVTWPGIGSNDPVAITSIVAPPASAFGADRGTASVLVVDREGVPLPGVILSLAGPSTVSATTNSEGCAVFGNIVGGDYTLSGSSAGRVDTGGLTSLSMPVTVVAQTTRLFTVQLDLAARITTSFDTAVAGVTNTSKAQSITVTGAGLPSPGTRSFTASSPPASSIDAINLFPLTGGYAVYAGNCPTADPRNAPTNLDDYFTTFSGQVATDPGAALAVTVRTPAINLVVRNSANAIMQNARVRVTAQGTGCETFARQLTDATGALPLPGYPFGGYDLCADDNNRHRATGSVQNIDPAGTAVVTLKLSALQSSNCP